MISQFEHSVLSNWLKRVHINSALVEPELNYSVKEGMKLDTLKTIKSKNVSIIYSQSNTTVSFSLYRKIMPTGKQVRYRSFKLDNLLPELKNHIFAVYEMNTFP